MATGEEIASYVIRGLHNEWIPRALERTQNVLGIGFEEQKNMQLIVEVVSEPEGEWIVSSRGHTAGSNLSLVINAAQLGSVDIASESGNRIDGKTSLDRVITHILAYQALNKGGMVFMNGGEFPNSLAQLTMGGYPSDLRSLEIGDFNGWGALSGDLKDGVGYVTICSIIHNSDAWGKTSQQTLHDMVDSYVKSGNASEAIKAATNGRLQGYASSVDAVCDLWDTFTKKYKARWTDFLNYAAGLNIDYTEQHLDEIIPERSNPTIWKPLDKSTVAFSNRNSKSKITVHYPDYFVKMSATEFNHDGRYIGGKYDDTIAGGSGQSSLWGGAGGNDIMTGRSDSQTEYFYLAGNGRDTIQGGNWGEGRDKLYLDFCQGFGYAVNGSNVTLKFGSEDNTLTIQSLGSQVVDFTTDNQSVHHAKFGKAGSTINYEENVDVYLGSSNSTLKVSGNGAQVWADGSHGKSYDGFTKIDGSAAGSVILAGNGNVAENIIGGTVSSSLWGGQGSSADTLVGGRGADEYYYGHGDGQDVITSADANDKVVLYNVGLEGVAGIEDRGSSLTINMADGGKLTINQVNDNALFVLSNGQSFKHNTKTKAWTQA